MSTKIYNAYRVRPGHDVWEVTRDIRARTERFCRKRLEEVYRMVLNNGTMRSEVRKTVAADGRRSLNTGHVSRWMRRLFREQLGGYVRGLYDLAVSVAVHRVGRIYLLRAFSGSGYFHDALSFLRRYRAVVDYHYQDQADRPESVRPDAWRERRLIWDRAMREDGTPNHQLVMEIVTPETWDRIDPWVEMERAALRRMRRLR